MAKNLLELKEERMRLITEQRSHVLDKVVDNTPTPEQVEAIRKADFAIEDVERQIKFKETEEREAGRIADAQRTNEEQAKAQGDDKDLRSRVFNAYLRGITSEDQVESEFGADKVKVVREIQKELRAAANQSVGTAAEGGYLSPKTFDKNLIVEMKYYGGILDIADVITTDRGEDITFYGYDDTAQRSRKVAEKVDTTVASNTGLVFTNPVNMISTKYTSGIVLISNELLNDEIYGVEGELLSAMGERFGRGINEDCTIGSGTAEPEGLATKVLTKSVSNGNLGLQSSAVAGITGDKLIDIQHSIDIAYRAKASWMMNDSVLRAIRKLKDGQGNYLWQAANIRTAEPDTLLGRAITINTSMSNDSTIGNLPIIYGDFKKGFRVRLVAGTVMRRLNERFAESDQVGFVGFRRYDSRVMRLSALSGLKIV